MNRRGIWTSVLLVCGLVLIFIARRVLGEGITPKVVLVAGVAAVLSAVSMRAFVRSKAEGAARVVETGLLLADIGVLVALLLYAASTEWGLGQMGLHGDAADHPATILTVLWPAVLSVSLAALLFMELAYRRMPVAESVELRRVRAAAFDGLAIALALVFVVSINYSAEVRDMRTDLSYFHTTKASHGTLEMVRRLGQPVKVILFYPEVNDVLERIRPYFAQVSAASKNLTVEVRDHALVPTLARKHHVRGNGFVLLIRGKGDAQQAEQIEIGTTLEEARGRLKTLDGRFQRSFMQLVTRPRELYLTTGHDEHTGIGADGDTPDMHTRRLSAALSRSNITTHPLGIAQGLADRVPKGAPAVAVVGPRKPFLPEEARSLLTYVQHGGRLIVMIDPDVDTGLEPLLTGLGLEMKQGVLASENSHIAHTHTLADRTLVWSNHYSAHPTVTVASRHQGQLATIFIRGGALARHHGGDVLPGVRVDFPIRSSTDVWRDLNGNFERDSTEPMEMANMMAAVTVPGSKGHPEGRAVVVADGDFATDAVIGNPGNALVLADVMQWLLGQEHIVGDTASAEDVKIQHTRDEDRAWFYGTSFGVPLPILGLGLWAARRRKRRKASPKKPADGASTPKGDAGDGGKSAEREAA